MRRSGRIAKQLADSRSNVVGERALGRAPIAARAIAVGPAGDRADEHVEHLVENRAADIAILN